jgi:hypothetical protein
MGCEDVLCARHAEMHACSLGSELLAWRYILLLTLWLLSMLLLLLLAGVCG